jgi:tRNA-dihydrouridine synthase A
MVVADDLFKKGDLHRRLILGCSDVEHPVALQLGGSDPEILALATTEALRHAPYDEINLNCGCPSPVVTASAKQFGARLMHNPELVRRCVSAMGRAAAGVPVTVKCRLGTDEQHGYDTLCR